MRLFLVACLVAVAAMRCEARTFKVLDAATDQPVAGVRATLHAHITLPGIGHPMELRVRTWEVVSDEKGEIAVMGPFSGRAFLSSLRKEGYSDAPSLKGERYRFSPGANPDLRFIVRREDVELEYIRILADGARQALEHGRSGAGIPDFMAVSFAYAQAKPRARTPRELEALREFCRFAPLVEAHAADWPDAPATAQGRPAGGQLLEDCRR